MNARYYVPSLGRFASADTLVPDPSNPQQFNRFSYVLNNPIALIDPSGHFSEEAIYQYLLDYECGGSPICADDTMWQWSQDTNWWEMLLNAQGGDILMLDSRHSIEHYTFKGEGQTKLEGFYSSDGNGDRDAITVKGSLWDLYVSRPRELVGFIRWENEMPSFYLSQNVEMTQYVTQDWVILAQDATWVMAGEGAGVILTSDPYVVSMLTAAAFNYLSFPDFWRSLTGTQSNNVRVVFTKTHFLQDGHGVKRHVGTMVFEQHLSNTGAGWRYTGR